MKKKILVVARGNAVAGAERVTLDVLSGLKDKYDVFCIYNGWNDGVFEKALKNMNIKSAPIKLGWFYITQIWWTLDTLINLPKALWSIRKIIKKFQPDIIYTSNDRFIYAASFLLNKIPVFFHVHDSYQYNKRGKMVLKKIDADVTKYIAVSNFIKEDLGVCGIDKSKVEVIHNGIRLTEEIDENQKGEFLTLGIVGQVIPRKGHEDLINALAILKEKKYHFKCKIIGKGDEEYISFIKNQIKQYNLQDDIVWEGYKDTLAEIYKDLNVVLVPTRNEEAFPLVPIEANSFRKPVIVSNKRGFLDFTINNENGFIVEPNAPKQIANAIEQFFINPQLLQSMGDKGRLKVETKFNKGIMIKSCIDLFENI